MLYLHPPSLLSEARAGAAVVAKMWNDHRGEVFESGASVKPGRAIKGADE
jgi:hypothetical protein